MPESATLDLARSQIYVSNVNHYAKDGNGFISRIGADGEDLELKWLDGLNSPTGLTVIGDTLYAVDYDELLKIDVVSGTIVARYPAPTKKPALNDVVADDSQGVFVTGSASAAIYKLDDEQLVVWMQDKDLLKLANGLFIDQDQLIFGGVNWLRFDIDNKSVLEKNQVSDPAVTDIDGIASDYCGGYFVTLIDDERIWHLDRHGKAQPVSEPINGIDLDSTANRLFVPTVGGGLSVFEYSDASCSRE